MQHVGAERKILLSGGSTWLSLPMALVGASLSGFFSAKRYWLTSFTAFAGVTLLTMAVRMDATSSIDRSIMIWVTGHRSAEIEALFNGATPVTRWTVHGSACLMAVVLFGVLGHRDRALASIGAGLVSGFVLYVMQYAMAHISGQVRPIDYSGTLSFPSGHALSGFMVFGFALFLTWRYIANTSLRVILTLLALSLIALTGASRVYFLRHWPADIAGSYLLGAMCLVIAISVFLSIERTIVRLPSGPVGAGVVQ